MKIKYLGTAAFEGNPAMFCTCDSCKAMKKAGGKSIRARTQALIDDKFLIDFHADTYMNFMRYGLDLAKIQHLLITHSHSDHLLAYDIASRGNEYAKNHTVLNIYGSKAVLDKYQYMMAAEGGNPQNVCLVQLKAFESIMIDGYEIIPLKSSHMPNEEAFVFLVEKDGKSLLYCNDTGHLPVETLEFLSSKGVKLNFIGFDCTYGTVEANKYGGHMSLYDNVVEFEKFKQYGIVSENVKVIVTHFSHWHTLPHEQMQNLANEFNFIVAYDGIEIEF